MPQRRKYSRVDVDLPVSCTFLSNYYPEKVSSIGHASNISLGGMKINIPLIAYSPCIQTLHYLLNLPYPFHKIIGHGAIRWIRKDFRRKSLILGIEFSQLDEQQAQDLKTILNELSEG